MWGQIGDKEAGCDVAWESRNPSQKTNARRMIYCIYSHTITLNNVTVERS